MLDKVFVDYTVILEALSRKLAVEGNVKGPEISVCDTLAYLIGWGKRVISWRRLTESVQWLASLKLMTNALI